MSSKWKQALLDSEYDIVRCEKDIEHYARMIALTENKESAVCKEWEREVALRETKLLYLRDARQKLKTCVGYTAPVMTTEQQEEFDKRVEADFARRKEMSYSKCVVKDGQLVVDSIPNVTEDLRDLFDEIKDVAAAIYVCGELDDEENVSESEEVKKSARCVMERLFSKQDELTKERDEEINHIGAREAVDKAFLEYMDKRLLTSETLSDEGEQAYQERVRADQERRKNGKA